MELKLSDVITHALELTGKLDRHAALQYFVDSARNITGAQFSALGVLDSHGETMEFIFSGVSQEVAERLGGPPRGHGVFADIPKDAPLVVNNLPAYPRAEGFPEGHPQMSNFLGVTVPVNEQIWGRLYLTDKEGGFTDDDGAKIQLFARAASIAVQNSQIYAESQNRARWLTASQNIVASLLEGSEEEEALEVIAHEMRLAAGADTALIVLPSLGDTWRSEIVDGEGSASMLGLTFPPAGRAITVVKEQSGVVVDSMQRLRNLRVPELRKFGPALYAPLGAHGVGKGVIILLRSPGGLEFNLHDLAMAENAAKQATIALELAEARHTQEVAAELDERSRISRDLHDLAIQQLFASGMQITAVKEEMTARGHKEDVADVLDQAISSIDESVRQIRQIVHSLRDSNSSAALVERLQHETSVARQSLGFAPSLLVTWKGESVLTDQMFTEIDDAVGADISDDVVAVVREGLSNAARHAHASSALVELDVTLDTVSVKVMDDGAGMTQSLSRRSGLSNLAARARRHRGTFTIGPRTDAKGTVMAWQAPLT